MGILSVRDSLLQYRKTIVGHIGFQSIVVIVERRVGEKIGFVKEGVKNQSGDSRHRQASTFQRCSAHTIRMVADLNTALLG